MRAVIFDMDGVLVDSEEMSCGTWLPVLRRRGIAVEIESIQAFLGQSDMVVLDYFRHHYPELELGDELVDEKEAEYIDIARPTLQAFPDLRKLLQRLRDMQIPLAVASSGRHTKISFTLETTSLKGYFEVVCSATDVARGKPAPDLFLKASDLLGVPPGQCSVIEDSVPGIAAARTAGMCAIGYTSSHSAEVLIEAGAHAVFSTYGDLVDGSMSLLLTDL